MNVGFYYMANAGGRLVGSLLSGVLFQVAGLGACLWASTAMALAAGAIALILPAVDGGVLVEGVADANGD